LFPGSGRVIFFFPVLVCAITASAVPGGGNFVSVNRLVPYAGD
jgi:hypothetical protein